MSSAAQSRRSLLLALLLAISLVGPLILGTTFGEGIFSACFALVMIAAAYAVAEQRRDRLVALALLAPALVAHLALALRPERLLLAVSEGFTLLFLAFVARVLYAAVLTARGTTGQRLRVAMIVYLLIGFAWASACLTLEAVAPGSYRFPEGDSGGGLLASSPARHSFVYYSFVTLTTLGYGDITPVTRLARSLAWLEALVGQLFVAVTIAGLVGLHVTSRERDAADS